MEGVNFKIIGCERVEGFCNPVFCKNCYWNNQISECKSVQKDRRYILDLVE